MERTEEQAPGTAEPTTGDVLQRASIALIIAGGIILAAGDEIGGGWLRIITGAVVLFVGLALRSRGR
jgi:hypothetical protein